MPYPVGSAIAETGSERQVTKKSSDLNKSQELKKTDSATKQEKEEYYTATLSDATPPKHVKKTGIPRVKSKPLEKRSSRDEKRDSEKRSTLDKISTEDKGKRTGSAIIEKTPNKKAQRAKGSTTIGRIPAPAARSRPTSSAVHLSRPCTREEDHLREDVQTPTSKLRPLKKGSRAKIKVAIKDSKVDDGINVQTKKSSWLLVKGEEKARKHNKDVDAQRPAKKESEDAAEDSKSDDPEMAKTFMPPLPSSTCSLFEKIQQSVRAYFTSKSTTARVVGTSEEPPKPKTNLTEGGINLD